MRESFIDKVYDTYISNDFSYGIDNLNPKREITPSSIKSLDDKIAEIYAELNKRLTKVKSTISDIVGEEEEPYTGNSSSETNNGSDDSHKKNVISMLGGHGSNIIEVPGIEDADDPLTLEIEIKILEKTLITHFSDSDTPPTPSSPTPPYPFPPPEEAPGLLPIDCTEYGGTSDGEIPMTDEMYGSEFDIDDDTSSDGGSNAGGGGAGGKNKNGGGGRSNDSMSDKARLDDAIDDALNASDKQSAKDVANMVKCAKAELGILKIILAILKVIVIFRKLMDPILSIMMEAVELVQLAAQCWNNPTCLATIVQKIASKVISILIGVIAQLLAKLFQMLGMDCYTEEVAQVMDEIRSVLAAISGIFSELNPTGLAMNLKDFVNNTMDTADNIRGSLEELTNNISKVPNDAMAGLKSSLSSYGVSIDDFSSFISDKSYRNKFFKQLYTDPSFPREDIQKMVALVDSAMQFPDDVKKVKEEVSNLTSAFSNEQKLIAQLDGLKIYTGTQNSNESGS